MSSLLVQSCSDTKNELSEPIPALELYDGYFFRIIKKARREDALRSDLDIRILSAKHGIVDVHEEIEYYDQRMTADRADELRPKVIDDLRRIISENEYDRVILNMGKVYKRALTGFERQINIPVHEVEGSGIGDKGKTLKEYVRGDAEQEVVQ
ncbi:hypothetical protein JCM17823_05100 [Halorubrum gandharaense]